MKELINKIDNLNIIVLRQYCFDKFETEGLLILHLLVSRFNKKHEFEIATIISELLNTVISHWEGKDLFEIHFYEILLEQYPNSEVFLECILNFYLPPYNEKIQKFVDIDKYKTNLQRVNPNNRVLKLLER
jgi:hypothetical protein